MEHIKKASFRVPFSQPQNALTVFASLYLLSYAPLHRLLRAGEVFFFDMQLDCPYYKRSQSIFNWPEMNLISVSEAISCLESMRKLLFSEGIAFGAEYAFDTFNEHPSSVTVTMTKL